MSTITQGEAVFQAVNSVLEGAIEGAVSLNESQREAVYEKVFMAFTSGQTVHSSNPSEAQLKKYIPGLVNNWLRKDKRLNGGTTYQTKRPGSRSGSGDESIKAMRTLMSVTTDADAKAEIQAAIDARVAELKPKAVINTDLLPESLRHLVQ